MPHLPDAAWFELAPDWICEILSPSTASVDRVQKMSAYAGQGVKYLWLADPGLKILEAYELQNGHWMLLTALSEDDEVSVPPFDATSFSLAVLWA